MPPTVAFCPLETLELPIADHAIITGAHGRLAATAGAGAVTATAGTLQATALATARLVGAAADDVTCGYEFMDQA